MTAADPLRSGSGRSDALGGGRLPSDASDLRELSDGRRAVGFGGVLGDLNAAGLLDAADLHLMSRLQRLGGEPGTPAADLGVALVARSVRYGSTCLSTAQIVDFLARASDAGVEPLPAADEIVAAITDSALARGGDRGPLRPLVVMGSDDGALVYFRKYFGQEQAIREILAERAVEHPVVDTTRLGAAIERVFGPVAPVPDQQGSTEYEGPDRQRIAAWVAARRWITVLAGGPGTGKTYTVSRILAVLDDLADGDARIGVCAPTGRAAAQVQAAIAADAHAPRGIRAVTVHSMLGWRPGSVPRHGRSNKLPFDVVVVDETSMLPMTAMSALLAAVRANTRVILVGDPHQLASVEAGAVLADLVERAAREDAATDAGGTGAGRIDAGGIGAGGIDTDDPGLRGLPEPERSRAAAGVVTLTHGYRFGGAIARLAAAINDADADAVLSLLADDALSEVTLITPDEADKVRPIITRWATDLRRAALTGDETAALDSLDAHRVLCAHREGAWGVQGWSQRIGRWLAETPDLRHVPLEGAVRYAGQPLLVTANDRQTGTFNGDCGVVVADAGDELRVVLRRGPEVQRLFPTQLADVVPVYAMTIHRSQGSQFDSVTVVLPPEGSELLTRELFYTAVTRARTAVRIVGTEAVIRAAVARPVTRASGLRSRIWPLP